jgi:hypothetical protein
VQEKQVAPLLVHHGVFHRPQPRGEALGHIGNGRSDVSGSHRREAGMKWPMVKWITEAVNVVRLAIRFVRMDGNNKTDSQSSLPPARGCGDSLAAPDGARQSARNSIRPGRALLTFTPWKISSLFSS